MHEPRLYNPTTLYKVIYSFLILISLILKFLYLFTFQFPVFFYQHRYG